MVILIFKLQDFRILIYVVQANKQQHSLCKIKSLLPKLVCLFFYFILIRLEVFDSKCFIKYWFHIIGDNKLSTGIISICLHFNLGNFNFLKLLIFKDLWKLYFNTYLSAFRVDISIIQLVILSFSIRTLCFDRLIHGYNNFYII